MASASPRLLFINQHYWPDVASTGQHLTDLAEHLATSGFDVEVLCASARYLAGQMAVPARETHHDVAIRRVQTTSFGRGSHLGRIVDYGSFYAQVLGRLMTGRRYDLVVALTTPPLLGFACALARRLRGQRYAIWSMDLHPDAEEAVGMIEPGSLLSRTLHRLNDLGYRSADLVVDLGTYMKARLRAKGVDEKALRTVPVWSKRDEIHPIPPAENPLRTELGLQDCFVVMYSGNAGLVHRFEEVLEVARRLRNDDRFVFLFVGGGPRRAEIEAFAVEHDLDNLLYLDYFPRDQLAYSLSLGDVHLLTLREAAAGIAVPGKLYGIMAAGRPVVVVGPKACESAETVRDFDTGFVVDPQTPDAADRLEGVLRTLDTDPDARAAMGSRAREAFLANYEQAVCCEAWRHLLTETLGAPTPAPHGLPTATALHAPA